MSFDWPGVEGSQSGIFRDYCVALPDHWTLVYTSIVAVAVTVIESFVRGRRVVVGIAVTVEMK